VPLLNPSRSAAIRELLATPWLRPLGDPLAIDDLLGLVDPTWSLSAVRARVVDAIRETADARTLVLRPNGLWRGHRSGQHVSVEVEIGGRRLTRSFSLSAPPRSDGLVRITVKRHDGGKVSPWWNEVAAVGDVVTLSQASGSFVLPTPLPPRIVMLSAGSGITPLMAMLRELHASGAFCQVVFVHCAHSRADLIFADELERVARESVHVDLRLFLSNEYGRLGPRRFARLAAEAGDSPAFVCGPAAFMQGARRAWQDAGLGAGLHFEHFGVPLRKPQPGCSSVVHAERSGKTFVALPGQSLLEAAEAAGLRPPHGCRAGVCHTCKCRKISGVVEDLRDGRIAEEPGEMIQLCISTAHSAVTLEL